MSLWLMPYTKDMLGHFAERVVISNLAQFKVLLHQEGYYINSEQVDIISKSRSMEVLDLSAMVEKGLEIGHFHSALEGV